MYFVMLLSLVSVDPLSANADSVLAGYRSRDGVS